MTVFGTNTPYFGFTASNKEDYQINKPFVILNTASIELIYFNATCNTDENNREMGYSW